MASDDTAGIAVPPPLVYLGSCLIGVGLDALWPVDFLPSFEQHLIGGILIGLSVVVAAPAALAFRRARTPVDPRKPTAALVTEGIFALTRNPLYVGLTLLFGGIAVTIDNIWAFILVAPAVAFVDRHVIAREERYLERKFGAAYLDYKARVRRWL